MFFVENFEEVAPSPFILGRGAKRYLLNISQMRFWLGERQRFQYFSLDTGAMPKVVTKRQYYLVPLEPWSG
jgi:hypothetical protein